MVQAVWHGARIADEDAPVVVEGNYYFANVWRELLKPSATTTFCPLKGTAHYYTIVVGDAENVDAAWYYPEPKQGFEEIRNRIAFWKGVRIVR